MIVPRENSYSILLLGFRGIRYRRTSSLSVEYIISECRPESGVPRRPETILYHILSLSRHTVFSICIDGMAIPPSPVTTGDPRGDPGRQLPATSSGRIASRPERAKIIAPGLIVIGGPVVLPPALYVYGNPPAPSFPPTFIGPHDYPLHAHTPLKISRIPSRPTVKVFDEQKKRVGYHTPDDSQGLHTRITSVFWGFWQLTALFACAEGYFTTTLFIYFSF